MEIIGQLIQFVKEIFSWWFIVTPWEQAVFVRAGKKIKVLKEGFYFKIPFIDQVYIQQIRLRTVDLPIQTISTADNKTITIKSIMTYSITDIFTLYNTISHPELTLAGIVMSEISDYIRQTNSNISEFYRDKLHITSLILSKEATELLMFAIAELLELQVVEKSKLEDMCSELDFYKSQNSAMSADIDKM